jgi:hypothetical protein
MENNNYNVENSENEKKSRPVAITVICVLGFIGAAIVIPLIFSNLAARVGAWYPPYLGLSAIVGFASMIGFWNMKKWAVWVYTGFTCLNQIILMVTGTWSPFAIIVPGIVIAVTMSHINKMD